MSSPPPDQVDPTMGAASPAVDPIDAYPIEPAPPPSAGRGRARRIGALAVAAAALAVIGAIVVANRYQSRGGDNAGNTTIAPPEPIGIGSPIDGKSSLKLPVRVSPDHDLIDGQAVLVTVARFRPRVTVGAVICTNEAQTKGAAACDIGNVVATAQTSADGRATIPYTIRRYPTINQQPYDCMQGNVYPPDYEDRLRKGLIPATPQPGWFGCIIAVGQLDDYDQSGGWPFALKGQVFRTMDDPTSVTAPTTIATDGGATTVLTTPGITTAAPSPTSPTGSSAPPGPPPSATRPTSSTTTPAPTSTVRPRGPTTLDRGVTTTAPAPAPAPDRRSITTLG